MKLTILGSGTSIIRKERRATSFLLEVNNKLLMFDCGWGSGTNCLEAGYPLEKIDHLLISHPHSDHMGNLMNIIQSIVVQGLYFPEKKRTEPFHIHAYKGFRQNYETLRSIMFPERIEPFEIKITEYLFNSTEIDDLIIQARQVRHGENYFNAVGWRLQFRDKVFVFSGDSGYTDELVKLAFSADLAIIEMGVSLKEFQKDGPRPNHLGPLECAEIAAKAGVKKLVLSHLNDTEDYKESEKEIRKKFTGEIIFAQDLMVVKI